MQSNPMRSEPSTHSTSFSLSPLYQTSVCTVRAVTEVIIEYTSAQGWPLKLTAETGRLTGEITFAEVEDDLGAVLEGTLTVPVINGLARFTDLRIRTPGRGFRISFHVAQGNLALVNVTETMPFDVLHGVLASIVQTGTAPTVLGHTGSLNGAVDFFLYDGHGNVMRSASATSVQVLLEDAGNSKEETNTTVDTTSGRGHFARLNSTRELTPGTGFKFAYRAKYQRCSSCGSPITVETCESGTNLSESSDSYILCSLQS